MFTTPDAKNVRNETTIPKKPRAKAILRQVQTVLREFPQARNLENEMRVIGFFQANHMRKHPKKIGGFPKCLSVTLSCKRKALQKLQVKSIGSEMLGNINPESEPLG